MGFELTEQIERHLISDQVVWLTTVTPTGRPTPRPVWFVWDGSAITVYSINRGAKLRHIAVNDSVSLNFNSTPAGGDVVVIAGHARIVRDAPLPSRFPGLLDKYMPTFEATGRTASWYDENYRTGIHITPDRAWTIP
jgi:PPOX class probable F420-dependent enzyme